jgi:hypothetical protein
VVQLPDFASGYHVFYNVPGQDCFGKKMKERRPDLCSKFTVYDVFPSMGESYYSQNIVTYSKMYRTIAGGLLAEIQGK